MTSDGICISRTIGTTGVMKLETHHPAAIIAAQRCEGCNTPRLIAYSDELGFLCTPGKKNGKRCHRKGHRWGTFLPYILDTVKGRFYNVDYPPSQAEWLPFTPPIMADIEFDWRPNELMPEDI